MSNARAGVERAINFLAGFFGVTLDGVRPQTKGGVTLLQLEAMIF